MKTMKKICSLFLALIMLLGVVACGGTTTTPPDILEDTPAETPETPAEPEAPTEEEPEVWAGDYETATFDDIRKYGIGSTRWDGSMPLSTTGEKLTIGIKTNAQVTDYDANPLTVWLEKTTGVDLEFHQFAGTSTDVTTTISLMFNGGEPMPDIITVQWESNDRRSEYLDAGYLVNVAGYYMTDAYYFGKALDLYCGEDIETYVMMLNNICNYSTNQQTGQVYGPVDITANPTDAIHTETMVNTAWLEKLNLKAPNTIDELYDVLVAFRDKDPNGNGKKDEVPLMGLTHSLGRGVESYIINAFIQYSHSRKAVIEDGKAVSWHDQDEYREALKFINKLVEEDLLSPIAFTGNSNDLKRMLNPTPNEPYTVGIACGFINGDYLETSNSVFDYDPLPALADYTGRGGYSLFEAPTVNCNWAITSNCENVLLAWRFLDFMYSPEAMIRQRWGEEGVDWDWIENTEYKDMAKGNGIYGGDAVYVIYNQGFRNQSRWFVFNSFQDEVSWQLFSHPDKNDYANTFYKKSVQNVLLQQSIGEPEERFLVFTRTPEEDERFHEFNTELSSLVNSARNQFCMGIRDPYSDADWNAYLKELEALNFDLWEELAQASYDRQKAELEAYLAAQGK